VEVAAEALKVGAEQQDQAAEILISQGRVRRDQRERRSALCLNCIEASKPVILPLE
jgi:hypothetical protein